MDLIFEYPIWFLLVALVVGLASGAALYLKNPSVAHWSALLRYTLLAARAISVFLIIVLLLGPLLRSLTHETEKPIVLVGIDNSSSIVTGSDSTYYLSQFRSDINELVSRISEKYEVRPFTFGNTVEIGDSLDHSEAKTDISKFLMEMDERFVGRNNGASILLSDGIVNRGSNPDYHKRRVSGPLYTVALGDTAIQRDQFIAAVDHNRYAYLGNRFPVEVTMHAFQLKGKRTELTVKQNGKLIHSTVIQISDHDFRKKTAFELNADKPGVARISISLKQIDGEISTYNNRKDVFVEVLDGRQKVLILAAAPHPDVAAIRRAVSADPNYEVHALVADNNEIDLTQYDLVILHQIPQKGGKGEKELAQIFNSDIPVWSIIGMQSDLSRVAGLNLGASVSTSKGASDQVRPILNSKFPLYRLDPGQARLLSSIPPLITHFGTYQLSPAARTLMYQKVGAVDTDDPLWVFSENSGRKASMLLGEGLWRWRIYDHELNGSHMLFDELITRTVQYLAVKTDKSQFRVSMPNTIAQDDALTIQAELYNESYELDNNPEVKLIIRNDKGIEYPFVMSRTEHAYRLNAGSFKEGDYTYTARTDLNGKVFEKQGLFRVAALRLESAITRADHNLMFKLADKNGGRMYLPSQLGDLTDDVLGREDIRNIIYEHTLLKHVIELKWLFFVLLFLLGGEWFLRKRNGAY